MSVVKQKGKAAEALNDDRGDDAVDARDRVEVGNGNTKYCERNDAVCQSTQSQNVIVIVIVIVMLPQSMLRNDGNAGEGANGDCDGYVSSRADEVEGSEANSPYTSVAAAVLDIQEPVFIRMSVVD